MILGRKTLGTVGYMGGVPAVLETFCWCWSQMVQYNAEFLETGLTCIHYDRARYSDHAPARNSLVEGMLGEWLLMLDTDHEFEPDILRRFLTLQAETGAQVISGLYRFKTEPYSPVAYANGSQPVASWPDDLQLFEIDGGGGGALFVMREVYNRITEELKCGPFDRLLGISEDHSFFQRCKKLGIKTYLAPRIEAHHLHIVPVTSVDAVAADRAVETTCVGGFA